MAKHRSHSVEFKKRQVAQEFFAGETLHGLINGGHFEEVVWNRYANDPARLNAVADAIVASLRLPAIVLNADDDIEIAEAEEGRVLTRLHRTRERSRKLVEQRKAQALKDGGEIRCEGCGFEYSEKYGEHGHGFIEVHHIAPLHTLPEGSKMPSTRMSASFSIPAR